MNGRALLCNHGLSTKAERGYIYYHMSQSSFEYLPDSEDTGESFGLVDT